MQVASLVAGELKAEDLSKLENIKKYLKILQNYRLVSSLNFKIKILSMLAKHFWKIEIETLPQSDISLGNYSLSETFPAREFLETYFTF